MSALSALRDCRLDMLHANVTAAHARLYLPAAREVVGKIDEALTLVNRLIAEAGG
jgi:hypothetical protein